MTGADLEAEWKSALGGDVEPLRAAGVPATALSLAQPAPARITVRGDVYEPDPEGGAAFILPVRCACPLSPEAADPKQTLDAGPIVDLLAFHPASPHRWALRAGSAEWLGSTGPQYLVPPPVRVHRTPLAWLRAGCRGIVLLGRDQLSRYRAASCLCTLLAEDERHAVELRRLLERPFAAPPVLVARPGRRHAG